MSTQTKKTLQELLQNRAALVRDMEDILVAAQQDGDRELREDETSRYDSMEERLDSLDKQIEEARKEEGTQGGTFRGLSPRNIDQGESRIITGNRAEFRNMFYGGDSRKRLDDGGFKKGIAEFFQAAAGRQLDPRLKEARTNIEGTGVLGGFAQPEGFSAQLLDDALIGGEIFRPGSYMIPVTTGSARVPIFDSEDRSDGSIFGFTLDFYGENENISEQDAKLRFIDVTPKKAAILWAESRELVADGPQFHSRLVGLLPRIIARGLDRHFYKGDGVGKPKGLINCAGIYHVTRDTADTILYSDIKAMWGAVHPECLMNAVWIINAKAVPQLLELVDGAGNSLWHPVTGGSIKDGVPTSLYGRPVKICESAPAIGTTGDICLADLSQYAIPMRQEMTLEASAHAGFARDRILFKVTLRLDGMGIWSKLMKLEDGNEVGFGAVLV